MVMYILCYYMFELCDLLLAFGFAGYYSYEIALSLKRNFQTFEQG